MTILKPVVPGTIIRFVGESAPRIEPSAADTVAVPIVSDWGPIGADAPGTTGREGGFQEMSSFAEFTNVFGDSDTPGRTAVAGAFAGQNIPGGGGAGSVIAYRMAGSAKAKAKAAIHFTGEGGVEALVLSGRYYGSRGNRLSYAVDVDPSNAARDRLRVLYNGATQETYLYTNTDIVKLAESINASSQLVRAEEKATGSRLLATVGTALAGGNDGSTLTAENHLEALEALEFAPFSILAPFDVETPELLASYVSWVKAQEEANRPVIMVAGGAAGEGLPEAITRTHACENPHVVNLGVGTYHDDMLDKDLSTAQLAPRIAGVLAARGKKSSLTFARIGGLHIVGNTGPSSDEIETAVRSGVVVLMRATSPDAELQIAKGVTTWTNSATPGLPVSVFGDPRLVRIMDLYVRDMKEWGDNIVIGALPVNDDTRGLVFGKARQLQDELLKEGLILPGNGTTIPKPFVNVEEPTNPELMDTIPYQFGWQFAATTDAILGEGRVR